jgi:hypothetical protein
VSVSILNVLFIAVPGAMAQQIYGIAYFLRGKLFTSTALFFLLKLIVDSFLAWNFLPSIGLVASAWSVVISYFVLQWCFVLFANTGSRSRKSGIVVMLWCHSCGLLLFLAESMTSKLSIALMLGIISLLFVRKFRILDFEELRGVFPDKLRWLEKLLMILLLKR